MNIKNMIAKVQSELKEKKHYEHEYYNFKISLDEDGYLVYNEEYYKNNYKSIQLIIENALDNYYTNN